MVDSYTELFSLKEELPVTRGDESFYELRRRLQIIGRTNVTVSTVHAIAERQGLADFHEYALLALELLRQNRELMQRHLDLVNRTPLAPFCVNTPERKELTYVPNPAGCGDLCGGFCLDCLNGRKAGNDAAVK